MHEHVRARLLADEAPALGVVEPLHRSIDRIHLRALPLLSTDERPHSQAKPTPRRTTQRPHRASPSPMRRSLGAGRHGSHATTPEKKKQKPPKAGSVLRSCGGSSGFAEIHAVAREQTH